MKLFELMYDCIECELVESYSELTESEMVELMNEPLHEAVERQFRRYGNEFKRQFRCVGGSKDGRMVDQPRKCGIRKDPLRVRIGKKSARVKKGQRIRKTLFTKRKTLSKVLQRRNKQLRDSNKSPDSASATSSTIPAKGTVSPS